MALLEAKNLVTHFPVRGGVLNRVKARVHAVNGVDLTVKSGETLGVVGESGCGKSTLGKTLIRLIEPTEGLIAYEGEELTGLSHRGLMPYRRKMQVIFQDPFSSLNPRMTVGQHIKEAALFHGVVGRNEADDYVDEIVAKVGLRPETKRRFPHEFSGGQRQRVGIARALSVKPEFIVADEPVSALDVSVQAQILNLLDDLRSEFGLTILFISHDLKVVAHFCDRVLVMYLGHIVEELPADKIDETAQHPYTEALLSANPVDDPDERRKLTVLHGDVPSPFNPPPGCPFAGRCPKVMDRCRVEMPPLEMKRNGHQAACWAVE
jgi:oligopeptide/dipeptide ABC transporter ATP-binding protein